MNDVLVVGTGGTFDKSYDPIRERLAFDSASSVPEILKRAHFRGCSFQELMRIDSLDMTEAHRQSLLKCISEDKRARFVVVHGTSRMVETGTFLADRLQNRTIILTGALSPYLYCNTEAAANFGGAVAAARLLNPGTYIFMHGRAFTPGNCQKNAKSGLFEERED